MVSDNRTKVLASGTHSSHNIEHRYNGTKVDKDTTDKDQSKDTTEQKTKAKIQRNKSRQRPNITQETGDEIDIRLNMRVDDTRQDKARDNEARDPNPNPNPSTLI